MDKHNNPDQPEPPVGALEDDEIDAVIRRHYPEELPGAVSPTPAAVEGWTPRMDAAAEHRMFHEVVAEGEKLERELAEAKEAEKNWIRRFSHACDCWTASEKELAIQRARAETAEKERDAARKERDIHYDAIVRHGKLLAVAEEVAGAASHAESEIRGQLRTNMKPAPYTSRMYWQQIADKLTDALSRFHAAKNKEGA